jgi:glutathione synthase/RimK-type ligase-like ATP-grasp enzyme
VPRVAFVTCQQYPQLTADDRLAALELERTGVQVAPVIWTDYSADWSGYDMVVLRSMWDYHLHLEPFLRWLQRLEAAGVRVWNPIPLARWNTDKRYLRDLRQRGVDIVPTAWFDQGATPSLRRAMEAAGWSEAVVKPVVSSTAYRTWRVKLEESDRVEPEFHALLDERAAMLQQYQPAIVTEGEWSLMFIAAEFSHAVLKRPVPGDFRSQEEYGGTTALITPPQELVDLAWRAVRAAESEWLYARVDAVRASDGFRVMELEMLEPGLFLLNDPAAAKRFSRAIRAQLLQMV